jgi:hypothetical protein
LLLKIEGNIPLVGGEGDGEMRKKENQERGGRKILVFYFTAK